MPEKPKMPNLANPLSTTSFAQGLILLRRCGIDQENVRLLLKGVFERYKGEIICHSPLPGAEIDSSLLVELELGLPSIVDLLPPSLFLGPTKEYRDYEKMDLRSRKLFSSFDSAIAKIIAALEYILLVYDSVFLEHSFCKEFLGAFGFPEKGWTSRELLFWTVLLPGFHQWAGTKKGTEAVLSRFLETKIIIHENKKGENLIPAELQSSLGKKSCGLGIDWCLGDSFWECESPLKIVVGPVSASEVYDFLPLGSKKKNLDQILIRCLPGQLRWDVALKLKEKEKNFSVGKKTLNCVLGYSTYLNHSVSCSYDPQKDLDPEGDRLSITE